jgi:hypothetical protein
VAEDAGLSRKEEQERASILSWQEPFQVVEAIVLIARVFAGGITMNLELYEQFVALKDAGRRAEAKPFLDLFIASFETEDEIREWVFAFLREGSYGHKIRHEIYENLVYPVLLKGYLERDATSIEWLARTVSNLYELRSPHPLLHHKSEIALWKEAYELQPSRQVQEQLLASELWRFDYAQHEWPAGILCGMNGASLEEYAHILKDVDFARSLDTDQAYAQYFHDFEAKVHQYMDRLRSRN